MANKKHSVDDALVEANVGREVLETNGFKNHSYEAGKFRR